MSAVLRIYGDNGETVVREIVGTSPGAVAAALDAAAAAVDAKETVVPLAAQVDADAQAVETARQDVETNQDLVQVDRETVETLAPQVATNAGLASGAADAASASADTAASLAANVAATVAAAAPSYTTWAALNATTPAALSIAVLTVNDAGHARGQYRYISSVWTWESDTLPGVDARAVGDSGVTGDILTQISTTEIIGRPTGTSTSSGTGLGNQLWALGPLAGTDYLITFVGFAAAGGTVFLKRMTKSGAVFTQVGSDYPVAIAAAGAFSLTRRDFGTFQVQAGEYVGLYANGVLGYTNNPGPSTWAGGTGNVSTFTDATVSTGARTEFRLTFGRPTVTEARVATLESANAAARITTLETQNANLVAALLSLGTISPPVVFLTNTGFWHDFSDSAQVFQDAAGATPVAANNDFISRINDKSGFGYHYSTVNSAERPSWVTNALNGRAVARFDGARILRALKLGLTNGISRLRIFAIARFASTGAKTIITFQTNASATAVRAFSGIGSTKRVAAIARQQDAQGATTASGVGGGTSYSVLEFDFDFAGGKMAVYVNGVTDPTASVSLLGSGLSQAANEAASYIGGSSTGYMNGDIGEIVGVVGSMPRSTRLGLYGYLCEKWDVPYYAPVTYDPVGPLPTAWTWYNDPRVIALSSTRYVVGGMSTGGTVMAGDYNAGAWAHYKLFDLLEKDDHDNPGFFIRSDGKIAALYSNHNDLNYWMSVSVNAGDPTSWSAPVNIGLQTTTNAAVDQQFSYANPIVLSGESNRVYNFHRNRNEGTGELTTHLSWSDDDGATWTAGKQLFRTLRPYVKARRNGTSRVDLFLSDGNPSESVCSIRHCYMQAGNLYKTDGTLIGSVAGAPYDQYTQLTTVYDKSTHGNVNSWVTDVIPDPITGRPVGCYVTYPADSTTDFRYWQARWTGSAWVSVQVCAAGGCLGVGAAPGGGTVFYPGGFITDPANANIVYCARKVGADGAIDEAAGIHQIFKYVSADSGATWTGTQLTFGTEACFRPFIPEGQRKMFYGVGRYTSFVDYDTRVGVMDIS